jgi:cytochrome c biogenesis protein ResB
MCEEEKARQSARANLPGLERAFVRTRVLTWRKKTREDADEEEVVYAEKGSRRRKGIITRNCGETNYMFSLMEHDMYEKRRSNN